MFIKYGRIKNINKKLISGALVLTLTLPLTACEGYEKFTYTVSQDGSYVPTGKIEYELLKNCCFLVIENSKYEVDEYYVVFKNPHYPRYEKSYTIYRDIFTDKDIFDDRIKGDREILVCENIGDYLYAINNIKASYTPEDLQIIFEGLKEDYLRKKSKELVKE